MNVLKCTILNIYYNLINIKVSIRFGRYGMIKVAYFALGETYGSRHAGFVHTYNIVKALSKLIKIKLFIKYGNKKTDIPATFVFLPSSEINNPIKSLKSYKKMKNEIKKFDIIHERFHINPIDLLFVKNKKYILEVNDPAPIIYSGLKKKVYLKLIKKKFSRANAIITQTETMKKILSKFYNGRIFIIPNGVDMKFFDSNKNNFDIRKRYKIPKNKIVITFVGAFREWHGVQDIPTISERIRKKQRNIVFLLVGNGPLFNEIKNIKDENMILTGSLPYSDIPSVLFQSDILIAPFNAKRFKSLERHGFYWCPLKIFEYMASGKPIVSYNFPEIKKITQKSALLAEIGHVDNFIENIEHLIRNEKLCKKIGKESKKLALEYDWGKIAEKTLRAYEEIIS